MPSRFLRTWEQCKYTHRDEQSLPAKVVRKLLETYGAWQQQRQGFSFFENHDWDIVIILDGCRYDTFAKIYAEYFQGRLQKKWSVGTCTPEWGEAALQSDYSDIVYLSTNPFISPFFFDKWGKSQPVFKELRPLWETHWDEKLKTVLPDLALQEAAQVIAKSAQKERLVLHLMQPHHPFVGEKKIALDGWESSRKKVQGEATSKTAVTPYTLLRHKQISRQRVIEAYQANLRLVLGEIQTFLQNNQQDLKSKRVFLTADHGNAFGAWGILGHPKSVNVPALLSVPWFEVTGLAESVV